MDLMNAEGKTMSGKELQTKSNFFPGGSNSPWPRKLGS